MPSCICILCNKCDSNLTIQCDGCKNYLHVSCAQIDMDDAKRITRQRAKGVKFFCDSCNKSIDQFTELKLMLKSIETRLATLEAQPSRSSEFFESVVRETKDRIQRDNNVIVYGVQEKDPETDAKTVKTLLKSVKPDITDIHSANIMRLGAATTKKPRPIRVVFTNPFVVRDILKNKSKLASIANYKEVFLKHDQTAHQRELYAKCRESLYARLSNGEKNLRIKFINGLPSVVATHNSGKN